MTKLPMRIQITCYNVLVAEAIVEDSMEADRVFAAYTRLKHHRGFDMGGAIIQRADLPRTFDVPVGSLIGEPWSD